MKLKPEYRTLYAALLVAEVFTAYAIFFRPEAVRAATKEPESFVSAEQLDTKNAAVTQCLAQQYQPVMGFNLKVVCLKPEGGIAWVR